MARRRREEVPAEYWIQLNPQNLGPSSQINDRTLYNFAYYQAHKEELRARATAQREARSETAKEKARQYARDYYLANKDAINKKRRDGRPPRKALTYEEIKAKAATKRANRTEEEKEEAKRYAREYYKANKEALALKRKAKYSNEGKTDEHN